ncbi:MAG: WG repeat-containing protein [Clostridiales bacterium]|nr:WG repeat-containing protein [Clostridiales bacterium]
MKSVKRIIIIALFIVVYLIVLTSCKEQQNVLDLENDIDEIINQNEQEVAFENALPNGVELDANTKAYTIVKYQVPVSVEHEPELILDFNTYSSGDSFIYGNFIGYKKVGNLFLKNYKYGFLNSNFSVRTEAIYDSVSPFINGKAIVKSESGYGVINSEGIEVIPCDYYNKPIIQNDYIVIESDKSVFIEYQFFDVITGSYKFSINKVAGDQYDSFNLIKVDLTGSQTEVPGDEYVEILYPYQDISSELYGYMDIFGRRIIESLFTEAYPFQQGLARIKHNNLYGYINNNGKLVIDNIYENAFDFKNDYARVRSQGKYGFINKDGELLIDYEYTYANDFSNGLSAVTKDGISWFYIDVGGKQAFDEKFKEAGNFLYGYAPVQDYKTGATVFIDKQGIISLAGRTFTQAIDINEGGFSIAKNIVSLNTGLTEILYIITFKNEN